MDFFSNFIIFLKSFDTHHTTHKIEKLFEVANMDIMALPGINIFLKSTQQQQQQQRFASKTF
jgi:hypothetical protein